MTTPATRPVSTPATWWNKSSMTNLVAAAFIGFGLLLPVPFQRPVLYLGLFALSGAITNWLAIHMLFERVPGLYGSGVIPARFEDIKREIRRLVMEQFFSSTQLERFFSQQSEGQGDDSGADADADADTDSQGHADGEGEKKIQKNGFDFDPIIEQTDLSPVYDGFISVVENSSLGGLLGMFGGTAALEPMREPFSLKMKQAFKDLARTPTFQTAIRAQLSSPSAHEALRIRVESLVQERLDELTAGQIKEIMQQMIRDHLGWLVVWGGVFGGLIGLITSLLPFV